MKLKELLFRSVFGVAFADLVASAKGFVVVVYGSGCVFGLGSAFLKGISVFSSGGFHLPSSPFLKQP